MKSICRILLCVVVIQAAVQSLSAQTNHASRSFITTKDRKTTIIASPSGVNTPYVNETAGLKTIFSNFAVAYPKGVYWCCEGATISGPQGPFNIEWWHAAAFTPTSAATVEKVAVSIGYLSGNDTSVILSLNLDNGGIPGAALEHWTVSNLGQAGTCCAVQVKSSSGIPLTAGQQYWIVVTTGPNSDVNASWNVADNDQIDLFLNAGLTNQNNNGWVSSMESPNVVFGVFGQ
ncbi:MAG: choice-of-anchor R domain-containing protein [Candidatus Sulfotelmatobacter sp.]